MNKKGEMEEIIKIISWIGFLVVLLVALYFLIGRFVKI